MSRRVVVTGVGLVSPLGIGTEATWQGILAGRSGIGPITAFDAQLFSCRIAGEIQGFDPASYIEKKEIKKMGRFIQFAIAAADCATTSAGLRVHPDEAENVGVYIGSGIGGFEVIEREHLTLLEHGLRRISPFFIPATIVLTWLLQLRLHPHRSKRTEFSHRDRLYNQRAFHRRFLPAHPARRRRCHDLRRHGSLHHPHGDWRVCGYARAFDAQ